MMALSKLRWQRDTSGMWHGTYSEITHAHNSEIVESLIITIKEMVRYTVGSVWHMGNSEIIHQVEPVPKSRTSFYVVILCLILILHTSHVHTILAQRLIALTARSRRRSSQDSLDLRKYLCWPQFKCLICLKFVLTLAHVPCQCIHTVNLF